MPRRAPNIDATAKYQRLEASWVDDNRAGVEHDSSELIELPRTSSSSRLKRRTTPPASRSGIRGNGNDGSSSDSSTDSYTHYSAGGTKPIVQRSRRYFIEHRLNPDDSVLSLSLKYNCSVSDLKRLNDLVNDQDLFALKVVKIPVSPFSSLTTATSIEVTTSTTTASNTTAAASLQPVAESGTTSPQSSSSANTAEVVKPDQIFQEIDSRLQESFFWLTAKQPINNAVDKTTRPSSSSPAAVITRSHEQKEDEQEEAEEGEGYEESASNTRVIIIGGANSHSQMLLPSLSNNQGGGGGGHDSAIGIMPKPTYLAIIIAILIFVPLIVGAGLLFFYQAPNHVSITSSMTTPTAIDG